jgi:hypothetical protein
MEQYKETDRVIYEGIMQVVDNAMQEVILQKGCIMEKTDVGIINLNRINLGRLPSEVLIRILFEDGTCFYVD